jgi:hypothetical protein
MRSSTQSLIKALRVLAQDIESEKGLIEAVLIESASRLEELQLATQKLPQWTSVDVALPPNDDMVLVSDVKWFIEPAYWTKGAWEMTGVSLIPKWWMPIPTPPKEAK